MSLVIRVGKNTKGRDLIIGDIHGCFTKMGAALRSVGFDPEAGDRLFSVGDLVDRGPESIHVTGFLEQDFVHAIAGNHERMAVDYTNGDIDFGLYAANGGGWLMALDRETQREIASSLSVLPLAIELETRYGLIGIVHAECPFDDWHAFTAKLEAPEVPAQYLEQVIALAQWSRNRIESNFDGLIAGVRAVVVGHTPMQQMTSLGNTIFIDTMGWRPEGSFTILDAETLRPARKPAPAKEAA